MNKTMARRKPFPLPTLNKRQTSNQTENTNEDMSTDRSSSKDPVAPVPSDDTAYPDPSLDKFYQYCFPLKSAYSNKKKKAEAEQYQSTQRLVAPKGIPPPWTHKCTKRAYCIVCKTMYPCSTNAGNYQKLTEHVASKAHKEAMQEASFEQFELNVDGKFIEYTSEPSKFGTDRDIVDHADAIANGLNLFIDWFLGNEWLLQGFETSDKGLLPVLQAFLDDEQMQESMSFDLLMNIAKDKAENITGRHKELWNRDKPKSFVLEVVENGDIIGLFCRYLKDFQLRKRLLRVDHRDHLVSPIDVVKFAKLSNEQNSTSPTVTAVVRHGYCKLDEKTWSKGQMKSNNIKCLRWSVDNVVSETLKSFKAEDKDHYLPMALNRGNKHRPAVSITDFLSLLDGCVEDQVNRAEEARVLDLWQISALSEICFLLKDFSDFFQATVEDEIYPTIATAIGFARMCKLFLEKHECSDLLQSLTSKMKESDDAPDSDESTKSHENSLELLASTSTALVSAVSIDVSNAGSPTSADPTEKTDIASATLNDSTGDGSAEKKVSEIDSDDKLVDMKSVDLESILGSLTTEDIEKVKKDIESFKTSLLTQYELTFEEYLDHNPPLAKYAVLDPRCHNLDFQKDDKEVKAILADLEKEAEEAIQSMSSNKSPKTSRKRKFILYKQGFNKAENVKDNIRAYLDSARSDSFSDEIVNPIKWWANDNRKSRFPGLAALAEKWLALSPILPRPRFSPSMKVKSEDHIKYAAFCFAHQIGDDIQLSARDQIKSTDTDISDNNAGDDEDDYEDEQEEEKMDE